MKAIIVFVLIPVACILAKEVMYDGNENLETFEKSVNSSCCCPACCPVIIDCGPTGTVIEPFSGWRGNAAVIVDWGCTEYNPCGCVTKGRLCTLDDSDFKWCVYWGDGAYECDTQPHLGPFQATHQYDKSYPSRDYVVKVFYCHFGCPGEKCCDEMSKIITVEEDPDIKQEKDKNRSI